MKQRKIKKRIGRKGSFNSELKQKNKNGLFNINILK